MRNFVSDDDDDETGVEILVAPPFNIDEIFGAFAQNDTSDLYPRLPPAPIPLPISHKMLLQQTESESDKPFGFNQMKIEKPTVVEVFDSDEENSEVLKKEEVVLDEFQLTADISDMPRPIYSAGIALRHEVVLPPGFDLTAYIPIKDHRPPVVLARTYPFKLDPFQQYAIYCVQRSESVLVSAHTSAGKTVVAEYAIAQALAKRQRVIYTSPIKALSNQKFRELQEIFGDVGLMTGDNTISPQASCLVMTTEILRSMLYRGSEILREISWVIYDEIHYMRDKDRGVVWEETLILLPHTVNFVFLSATIPNAKQFAQWICRIHNKPCHVVYTDFRPTPLQHYMYPKGAQGMHLVVDEKGAFRDDNFNQVKTTLDDNDSKEDNIINGSSNSVSRKRKSHSKTDLSGKTDITKVVRTIMKNNFHPVIVFAFSKKECEENAIKLESIDFNDETEANLIENVIFPNAIADLEDEDRNLPTITNILPFLKRGIGFHHSGLLPILKEIVEVLFQEGLIKVLFATETFSIGLNMPAKTVVFKKILKFDGKEERYLTGGEYIQMSGRAGRRGLDSKGIVVMMLEKLDDAEKGKIMLKGEADALYSAFRLGYNTILNLLRVEGATPEYLLRNSFRQFQNNSKLPQLQQFVAELEAEYALFEVNDEKSVRNYYEAKYTLDTYTRDVCAIISHPAYSKPFLNPGRLLHIVFGEHDFGWGVLINFGRRKQEENYKRGKESSRRKTPENVSDFKDLADGYILDVALVVESKSVKKINRGDFVKIESLVPAIYDSNSSSREIHVVPVLLSTVVSISSVVMQINQKNIKDDSGRRILLTVYDQVMARTKEKYGSIPVLDPIKEMNIDDKKFPQLMKQISRYQALVEKHPDAGTMKLKEGLIQYDAKLALSEKIKSFRREVAESEALLQLEELKSRKRVLRRLGYINESDVVELKGRVACELSAGDSLLLTEMLFHGVFNDLSVSQTVALLGVFTFTEKGGRKNQGEDQRGKSVANNKAQLTAPLETLKKLAKQILSASKEARLEINEKEYLDKLECEQIDVVYAFAEQSTFLQICNLTEVFEGSLVRSFRLLIELLKEMIAAAKVMGSQDLEIKFAEGITRIKRSVVISNSLQL